MDRNFGYFITIYLGLFNSNVKNWKSFMLEMKLRKTLKNFKFLERGFSYMSWLVIPKSSLPVWKVVNQSSRKTVK